MADSFLETLRILSKNESEIGIKVLLVVDGSIIHGEIAPHASVTRDIYIGLDLPEDHAISLALIEGETGVMLDDVLSLTDVTIQTGSQFVKLPFLRVKISAVSAWFSGGVYQIEQRS